MTDEHHDEEAVALGNLLAEGRDAICTALAALAAAERRPDAAALLLSLKAEVESSRDGAAMDQGRADDAFRHADDYWRRRWDEVSDNPSPAYEEQVAAISTMYRARRTAFEWRWPGKWRLSHTL